ncbi:membrane fusion protein, Cu(I)/Ag(I) efflux system [Gillisia sp. Hel1_33_143]|uniref:efflux RND transporter periplasmic adaptor subunit n=1 Tax=Gillisia sp. Hel1_33_143 TaxID=1336796 RepID=UPI00087DAADA|nr:efflux RND transporter periplasmic adaptor subunit [Gillisia sp. Hel1_33_143]SDS02900.1 membrane fusion protein, Cu(I)/Ag(I) efflux system [Gillisia sp. Hel1_33_143]
METKKIIGIVIATLLVGALIGWLIKPDSAVNENELSQHDHENSEEVVWTCSMHPQIRRSEPGACPICGMDLIPLNSDAGNEGSEAYQMSENAMKLANVTTMIVGKDNAEKEIRLNGKVQVDERNAYSQSTHIPGRIESLALNFTGEKVSRGQTLATIYSPQLVTAQEELLQAASIKESQPELFEAAKEKLRNWKIGNSQIERILSTGKAIQRFPISADVNGIVTEKKVELGDYVERGMPIYEISDLSKVWVLFDLYESELNWVKEGSEIEYTVNSLPGETFKGKITFIDPLINSQTRVASARVEVSNKDGKLKPEMFVSGTVKNSVGVKDSEEIVVPKTAVLWTGERSVVYVKEEDGFTLRQITLGPALRDSYIVQAGLETGEEIVANGTFTVDAAVQLSGRPSMMNPSFGEKKSGAKISLSDDEKKKIEALLSEYLKLKDALVADDLQLSKKEIAAIKTKVEEINTIGLKGEAEKVWKMVNIQLINRTKELSEAKDLKEIRGGFDELSSEVIMLVSKLQVSTPLFVLHCPMADNNRGADWISLSSEVLNPYYGNAMLGCGEVTKTIGTLE